MTIKANILMSCSDLPPEQDIKAFINAYNQNTNVNHLKQHQSQILNSFKQKMKENMEGNESYTFNDSDYFVNFNDDSLVLGINSPDIVYNEYGTEEQGPNYVLRPAVEDISQEIKDTMIQDTLNAYYRQKGIR